jgi:glycosyltransferase involved in cell wall biosynthesis
MAAAPQISIVIPNYNYARFLDERFRSILAQSPTSREIIFLDDASSDESVTLVQERYRHCIDHFEANAVNSGNPFVQWNRGVRLARGEFVWIAEADDTCTAGFLEGMLAALKQSPSLGLAYCTSVPVDGNGQALDAGFHQRYLEDLHATRWQENFVANGRSEVRNFLGRKNTITNVSGVLFRRAAYAGAGYAPENLRMCGDWLAYCRILRDWDVAFVNEPLNFHRQHPTKHTQNSVLDLTYFREFLQVQNYVAQAFELGAAEREEAFRRFLGEWDRLTVSHYGRIDLYRTLALARIAANSYHQPKQVVRIAAHLAANTSKSIAAKCLLP